MKFGYKLMTEEHGPKAIVENAVRAEAAGFDFLSISDHFHPWLEAQGHAGFAWSMLGAIAHATSTIGIATGLTCPILRYHPAIIAQAAATIQILSDNRFTLAIGAGERLNEHVAGQRWPSVAERHAMLGEAAEIMRLLWQGGVHSFVGEHYVLDSAQLFDTPERPIPLVIGVSGPHSVALAAEQADGIMATEPKPELVADFRKAKGGDRPAYAEALTAWAATEEEGLRTAHEKFRFGTLGWAVMSELPTVKGFEAATKSVRIEDMTEMAAAGPEVATHLRVIQKYADAGFDHIVLTCPGDDQAGFMRFFEQELRPRLGEIG